MPIFPSRRSRIPCRSREGGNLLCKALQIPAFAGMTIVAGMTVALLLFTTPALAATTQGLDDTQMSSDFKYSDAWSFRIAPHTWLAGITAQTNIEGNRADFSTPFWRIFSNLDFSLGAEFEASKGLWTLVLDPDYVKETQSIYVNDNLSYSTYESTMTDAGVYYRLYPQPTSPDPIPVSAEIFGGARVITLHTSIHYRDVSLLRPSDTSNLIVPLLGLRVKHPFCMNYQVWFIGTVGGFQVNHVSNTWSGALGLTYAYNHHWDFSIGYKAFGVNYSIQAVSINSQLWGPEVGFAYSW